MKMLINNTWVGSQTYFDIVNPYTGKLVDTVPNASPDQIQEAIERSYETKCLLSYLERSTILKQTAKQVYNKRKEISYLITQETGLCLQHTLYEVKRAVNCIHFCANQAEILHHHDWTSEFIIEDPLATLTVIAEPWDLAIGITPFNHALNMMVHKVAPAIAAGTAMVIKPSEKTPLTALKFGEILIECGLPKNLLNIVTGIDSKKIVDQLVTNPKIDIVSFTGGVNTGKAIARTMVNNGNELKKYMPELGGNAAFVVMDDCNVDEAAKIALGAFANSGQRCTAVRKIFLHHAVADAFMKKFIEMTSEINCGDPFDMKTGMGTVISVEQAKLIERRVNLAVEEGARVMIGNQREGALYPPTIVDEVDPKSKLVVEETFGPVASIIKINSLDEAISLIKADKFGLASAIATASQEKAIKLQQSICVGQFSWNGQPGYRTEKAPFGGFGDSGNGEKEGTVMMTRAMLRIKTFYAHNTKVKNVYGIPVENQ
jgi:aldehyde dehydrogenase (NAD+)